MQYVSTQTFVSTFVVYMRSQIG